MELPKKHLYRLQARRSCFNHGKGGFAGRDGKPGGTPAHQKPDQDVYGKNIEINS